MPSALRLFTSSLLLGLTALTACGGKPKDYDTEVQITRKDPIERDARGVPRAVDVEVSYIDCPGTQSEVLRGDATFLACISGLSRGARAKATVRHRPRHDGRWESVIVKLGACARVAEVDDPSSYTTARECVDKRINGVVVGFDCDYTPEKALVERCPWFRR